jgi:hypothetical protein
MPVRASLGKKSWDSNFGMSLDTFVPSRIKSFIEANNHETLALPKQTDRTQPLLLSKIRIIEDLPSTTNPNNLRFNETSPQDSHITEKNAGLKHADEREERDV